MLDFSTSEQWEEYSQPVLIGALPSRAKRTLSSSGIPILTAFSVRVDGVWRSSWVWAERGSETTEHHERLLARDST